MTNKKFNSKEIISEEQLDQVSGGTVKEFDEIFSAASKNSFLKGLFKVEAHIPLANMAISHTLELILIEKLDINADISFGWGGTGAFSEPNTYKDALTGRSMSHSDVINRIKCYAR